MTCWNVIFCSLKPRCLWEWTQNGEGSMLRISPMKDVYSRIIERLGLVRTGKLWLYRLHGLTRSHTFIFITNWHSWESQSSSTLLVMNSSGLTGCDWSEKRRPGCDWTREMAGTRFRLVCDWLEARACVRVTTGRITCWGKDGGRTQDQSRSEDHISKVFAVSQITY